MAIDLLNGFFQAGRQYVIERRKLRQIKQQEGEKFSHFLLRLRQQTRNCGFEQHSSEVSEILKEIYLTDVVVENCRSDDLRRSILKKDRSLSEIEEIAASIEDTELQMLNLKKPPPALEEHAAYEVSNVRNLKRSPPPTIRPTVYGRGDKRISPRSEERSDFYNLADKNKSSCFACGEHGHFAKSFNCPARGQTCRRCRTCRKRKIDMKVIANPKRVYNMERVDPVTPTTENNQKEEKVFYAFYGGNTTNVLPGIFGGVSVQLLVDSGADANLIKPETWEMMKRNLVRVKNSIKGSSKVLKGYGSNKSLTIVGSFEAEIIVGKAKTDAEFFVVQGGQRDILGNNTSKQLGVLKVGLHVNEIDMKKKPFSKISGVQAEIHTKQHVKPVFQPLRRVPIPMEEAVNKKLEELLDRDIIEVKQGPTTWVSPLVVVGKASGEPRICLDLRRVNEAIVRERFPMPVVEEYLARLCHGKVWSKLDIKEAFHQVELAEESRDITTFITNRGLFRFKRLPFGLVSAPEIFQRIMEEILAGCDGDRNIADALSRLSTTSAVPFDLKEEVFIREVVEHAATASALKWEEIEEASKHDDELSEVGRMIQENDHRNLPLAFKVLANELCVVNGVLMRVDRIIIPTKLRERVLSLAHEGHPGMRLMKSHLRANVWWPNMDQQVEKFVRQCRGCSLVAAPGAPEPMTRKELPNQPWVDIAADFLGPLPDGQYLLVVID
ncbi:uncharacterized protein K02A2.6-like [Toxorhynchites rutilus septentrionalis]|uniref:uncharacterized protein K02A2.6-like n=1 Tax=Toxorhynchites rutilus septentrionalis TaxID=329112 RepID=UPI0024791DCB|nr:uncharacterized protein K02A2.6-like [Toxorhynchites rutilus septentrionalis]